MPEEEEQEKVGQVRVERGEVSPEQIEEISTGEYFTIEQIARRLSFTHSWLLKLVKQGRIKGIKPMGGRWRIPKSEFERLIKEGIPPLPREQERPPVTEILVEDEKVIDKVKEPEKKEGKPPGVFLDFFGTFG